MAGRTQIPQIFSAVVQPVSGDVVDLQDESSSLPDISHPADLTGVRDTEVIERTSEKRGLGAGGSKANDTAAPRTGGAERGEGGDAEAGNGPGSDRSNP